MARPRKNPADAARRGGPASLDAKNQFVVRLNDEDYEALKTHAEEEELSMAHIIRRAIREYLAK